MGRAARRRQRQPKAEAAVGPELSEAALDVLELVELAWHDCYGDVTPDDRVIDDILVASRGRLDLLIGAARLAVADWRDLRVVADGIRTE